MAGIGQLTVGMVLDYAEFSRGLTKAQVQAKQATDEIIKSAKQIAGAFGAYLTVDAFKGLITGAIDAADHLNDLSKKTGIAVETLGGIGFAAGQAGGDLESASAAAGKLNKSLAEAAAGNKEAQQAFTALGLSVKDATGNTKSADAALVEIANKFAGYADGPEKAALALRLFGKAGADIIPLLNDGGKALQDNIEYYKRYSGITQEVANQADAFNDTLGKLNLLSGAFGRNLASSVLPTLQVLADAFLNAKEQGDGFKSVTDGINVVFKALISIGADVAFVLLGIGREIGAIAAQGAALARLDFKGFSAISDAVKADGVEARKSLDDFQAKLAKVGTATPAAAAAGNGGPRPNAPRLPGSAGAAGPKDDPTKKLLDNQLKEYERAIADERDLLQSRNRFIDLYNGQNLLSITDYYKARQVAADAAVAGQVANYDKEIAALKAYQAALPKKGGDKERADAAGKIAEIESKRDDVIKKASEDAIVASVNEAKAKEDLVKSYQNVNAQVLELQGNLAAAAAIRFDASNDVLKKQFSNEGNEQAVAALETLRKYTLAQAEFSQLSNELAKSQDALRLVEERLQISRETGAISELSYLKQISDARAAAAQQQAGIASKLTAVASDSGLATLKKQAQDAQIAVEQLASQTDLLAKKFTTIFEDSFGSSLADFINGTKSAKEAFQDFEKSIVQSITKIASQNIAESLFGGGGAAAGAGGFFSKLFGGGGASAAGGIGSFFSSLFGFATGGMVSAGGMYKINERGPEVLSSGGNDYLLTGNRNGKITPNAANSSTYNNVTINASGDMSKQSARQLASEVSRRLSVGSRDS